MHETSFLLFLNHIVPKSEIKGRGNVLTENAEKMLRAGGKLIVHLTSLNVASGADAKGRTSSASSKQFMHEWFMFCIKGIGKS